MSDEGKGILPNSTPQILATLDNPLKVVGLIVLVSVSVLTVAFYGVGAENALRAWYPLAVLGLLAIVAVLLLLKGRPPPHAASSSVTSTVTQGEQSRGGIFHEITGNVILGDTVGPSAREQQIQSEVAKTKLVLNQFDRRSVGDLMHEEDIGLMVNSLEELRINIQQLGKSTLEDRELRVFIESAVAKLNYVNKLALEISQYPGKWENSIFDLRIFGTLHSQRVGASTEKLARAHSMVQKKIERQYGSALNKDMGREAEIRENAHLDFAKATRELDELRNSPARKPLDVQTLAWDFAVFYLFGILDQVKSDVAELVARSRERVSKLSAELR